MLKKLLSRKKKDKTALDEAQPNRSPSGSDWEEGDEDGEAVHEYEQAQEEYLLHVALANSAKEYQRSTRPARAPGDTGRSSRATALTRQYWSSGRCARRMGLHAGCMGHAAPARLAASRAASRQTALQGQPAHCSSIMRPMPMRSAPATFRPAAPTPCLPPHPSAHVHAPR